jgi:hypothetical protein
MDASCASNTIDIVRMPKVRLEDFAPTVVDRESDFATGGHRAFLIAFSARLADATSIDCHLRGPLRWFAFCTEQGRWTSPRQDDFANRPILNQMTQGSAHLVEGIDPLDDRLD